MAPEAPAVKHTKNNLGDIKLEDIDFEVVKECTEKEVAKKYIQLLVDDGSYFYELLDACKNKLLELCPKDYYLLYPRVASTKEVDDITKDLLDWQASVAETDTALRSSRKHKIWSDVPGSGVAAPIRGQEAVVSRANVSRKEEIKDQEKKVKTKQDEYARDKTKMKDYYRSWEQMDVDEIEAEMDKEEADAEAARKAHFDDLKEEQDEAHRNFTPHKVGNLPANVPEAHRKHLADTEKEKGNEAFYSKDYEEAEAYYARSLHYRPDDPSCWANRALSRLKLDNAAGALEDCEHALAINNRYMKALHRKGKALYELQRYEDAVQAFQLALMESPGNSQINGDLMVARRKLRSDGSLRSEPPKPQSFAPPSRTRDPRDEPSCIIEEVFDDEEEEVTASTSRATPVTTSTSSKPAPGYTRVVIEEDSDSEEEDVPAVTSKGFTKVQIEEESDSEENEPEKEPATASVPSTQSSSGTGFHKIQIVEDSDSEEDEEIVSKVSSSGKTAEVQATEPPAASGFRKIQIVDDSESEEDDACVAGASAPAVSVEAGGTATENMSFDDMD